tara:strand:+ start:3675 stop:5930 length:2256 start_codon:yes stop_codon:yes gene_type:complete
MATIAELKVKIGANVTDFDKKLSKVQNNLQNVGKKMQSIGKGMTVGITAPLGLLGAAALKSASDLETMGVAFESMLGSGEAASQMVKDLSDFTAKTPFQLEGVGKAAKQLLSFGVQGDQVIGKLKFLGDIAAGANIPLSDMASIFGKSKAKGKAMTEELLQLSDRGVPVIDTLAKKMRVSKEAIFDMASKGKISFEILQDSLISLTQEGGVFANQMEKQSNTMAGIWSTLKDNIGLALADIGNSIVEGFDLKNALKSAIAWIQELTKRFKELSPQTKKIIVVVAGLAAAAGPLIAGLGFFASTVLPALITGFTVLTGPVGWIIGGITILTGLWIKWGDVITAFAKGSWAALQKFGENVANLFDNVGKIFDAVISGEFAKIPELVMGIKFDGIGDAFDQAYDQALLPAASEAATELGDEMADKIEDQITNKVPAAIKKAFTFKDVFGETFSDFAESLGGFETKLKATKDIAQPLATELEDAQNAARALSAAYDEKPVEILQRQRDVLKSFIDTQIQGAGAITPAIQEMIDQYDDLGKKIENTEEKTKLTLDKIAQVAQQVIGAVGQVFGQITDLIALQFQKREIAMDNFYAKQQEHLDNTQMSEKARANAQKMLDEDVAKSKKKFAKEKAKADKKAAIASAIMNTASAVANALTAGPIFGPILAVTIGALGAAQIATIKSTPIPSFATGGIVGAPMIAMVGDAPTGPEVIAPLDKLQSMLGLGGNLELSTVIRGEDIILVTDRTKANRGYIE